MAWRVPTIASIQRTNLVLLAVAALALAGFVSSACAVGCLIGGAVVIANLFILSLLGRLVLAAAGAGPAARRAGVLALPLKLLLVAALVYLLFARAGIDGAGFGAGVLTQLFAVFIETWRASTALRPDAPARRDAVAQGNQLS